MLLFTLPILLLTSVFACEGDYRYCVPAYCEMLGCRPHTLANASQAQQISRDLLPPGSHHDSMQYHFSQLFPWQVPAQRGRPTGLPEPRLPGYMRHPRLACALLPDAGNDAYERAERAIVQAAAGPHGREGERRRVRGLSTRLCEQEES